MRMRHLLTTIAVSGLLAVAGCGDDEEPSGGDGGNSGGGGASGDKVTVTIKDIKFVPQEATVKVGQTVEWVNEDSVPHNVIGGPLQSENLDKGATYTFEAQEAGTIDYECTIHPGQTGKLIVE